MKNFFTIKKNHSEMKRGFMMVEILVATSIIVVVILSVMAVSQRLIHVSRQSLHTAQAGFLLEEGAEAVRILRDNAWTNVSSLVNGTTYYLDFTGSTWVLSTTPSTVGIFTRTVSLASVNRDDTTNDIDSIGTDDPGTKLFTITVSWSEGGAVVNKTLLFYITDLFS